MDSYSAPLNDQLFVLRHLVDLEAVAALPGNEDFSPDLADAVLEEAGKLATEVLAPLNRQGDLDPARCADGVVTTSKGWQAAYRAFIDGGWNGLACAPEHGGQGLPRVVAALVEEIWNSANMAFTLCPMLTRGAIEALELRGSDALKATYLEKLVSGEWTGTMNLTEPQAGSDLAAVRTRALPQADGSYRISGQKIFITYGEHDLTDNIIHLVLARTPDAPEGVKGISLFVVPKFLVNDDGSLGARNDVVCGSIEHKLGIHGSPTCTMDFGRGEGAIGFLVGEECRGLEYMFIMMNAARFGVGVQGLGLSERALQAATQYAEQRVQGTLAGDRSGRKVAIAEHPDVRRMLLTLSSQTEAMRALVAVVAEAMDYAEGHPDAARRATAQAFVELMIPVVKGCMTENAVELTSLGVQVHGGMGYVEETGAAQYLRDARITTIYEGTTAIQAADLIGRKIARDGGAAATAWLTQVADTVAALEKGGDAVSGIAAQLAEALSNTQQVVAHIVAQFRAAPAAVLAGSVPVLRLFGLVAGGWQLGRSALVAQQLLAAAPDAALAAQCQAKLRTAEFYAWHLLPQVRGLSVSVLRGGASVLAV